MILSTYERRGFVFERRIDLETGGAWWRTLVLRKAATKKGRRLAGPFYSYAYATLLSGTLLTPRGARSGSPG